MSRRVNHHDHAWVCRLESGRWIVVLSANEAAAPYYRERRKCFSLSDARDEAYWRNMGLRDWKQRYVTKVQGV